MMDAISEKHIATLHPEVQAATKAFLASAAKEGINLRVYFGLRTIEEQNKLYAQGRTTPGKVVTWAKGGSSYHNYGLAIDVVEIAAGKALWENPRWHRIGEIGERLGFEWGGRWKKTDKPHFQMRFGLSIVDLKNGKRP